MIPCYPQQPRTGKLPARILKASDGREPLWPSYSDKLARTLRELVALQTLPRNTTTFWGLQSCPFFSVLIRPNKFWQLMLQATLSRQTNINDIEIFK